MNAHITQHIWGKKTTRQIKKKTKICGAMISKADKDNSIIITYQDEYQTKS